MGTTTDWTEINVFPLQDHEDGVPLGIRQQLVGGRIVHMADPGEDEAPENSYTDIGREHDMGTLGDIHPWLFWQTRDRGARGMGAWQSIFAGITADGATAGPKSGRTGQPGKAANVLPVRSGRVSIDGRFYDKYPGWPKCFPLVPAGTLMAVAPGTEESAQHELMLHTDPRLVAVNAAEPGESGTLVVDLQPDAEMCMGSDTPGKGGRHARLQSVWRVIPMSQNHNIPGIAPLNSVAWNLAASEQDHIAGLGMCYARTESGGGGGATTHRRSGPITGPRGGLMEGAGHAGEHDRNGDTPSDFGEFGPRPRQGHAIGLAAQVGACGPLTVGAGAGDKHAIGADADGHAIGSLHISTKAYHFMDAQRDGPLFYEKIPWPEPKDKGFPQMVHLTWDGEPPHPFIKGARKGYWKWFTNVPYFIPDTGKPIPRITFPPPGGGPNTPGPTVPAPTGPGPGGPVPGPVTPPGPPGSPPRGRPTQTPRGGGNPTTGPRTPWGGGSPRTGPRTPWGGSTTGGRRPRDIDAELSDYTSTRGAGLNGEPESASGGGGGGGSLPGSRPIGPEPPSNWGHDQQPWFQLPDGSWNPAPGGPRTRHGGPNPWRPIRPIIPGGHEFPLPPWLTHPKPWTPSAGINPRYVAPLYDHPSLPQPDQWPDVQDRYPSLPDSDHGPDVPSDFWPPDWPWQWRPPTWDILAGHKVGGTQRSDQALFQVWHPMQEGFAELSFRPQLMVAGAQSFTHNPDAGTDAVAIDESSRPQVLAVRTWGGQNSSGEWDYQETPQESRARGGTAHGGLIFTPPTYELEDYFGINSSRDIKDTSVDDGTLTASYVTCAPGVAYALGTPDTGGGLGAKSIVITQWPTSLDSDEPLKVQQLDSAKVGQTLFEATWDDTNDEARVTISGTTALQIPSGTDAQRPTSPVAGQIRLSTTATANFEGYDGSSWLDLSGAGGGGGVSTWIDLTDTDPTGYGSQAGKFVRVNSTPNGLEFYDHEGAADPHDVYALADGTRAFSGSQQFDVDVKTDTIIEKTATAGVTIDGLLIKDSGIPEAAVTAHEAAIDHDALTNFAANEHFTEASIDHVNIQNKGSNTHAQIDTHIASTSNPHSTTLAGLSGVTITAAVAGDILRHNGAGAWVDVSLSGTTATTEGAGIVGLTASGSNRLAYNANTVESALVDINTYDTTAKGANLVGVDTTSQIWTGTDVQSVLEEMQTALDARPVESATIMASGATTNAGDQNWGGFDLYNVGVLSVGHATNSADALIEVQANPAATPDTVKSIALTNDTAATTGAQKYSPMLRWQGNGYDSLALDSAPVHWREYLIPVEESSAPPTVDFIWESKVDAGAWTTAMAWDGSVQLLTVGGASTSNVGVRAGDAFVGTWSGSSVFAVFAHNTVKGTSGSYAVLSQSNGATFVNAASGQVLSLRNNNSDVAVVDSGGIVMAAGKDIELLDNDKVVVGTGKDATIYFDGTDMHIVPDEVGTGNLKVGADIELADNDKLVLGTGDDATIYYDGTNLQINSSAVGTGDAKFSDKVDAADGFADNGTAGIDKTFSFSDGAFQTHDVVISGGIITQWDIT